MSLKSELQEILAKNIHPALLEVLTPSEVLVIFKELAVATDQTLDLLDKSLPEAHDTSWVGKELVEPEVPIDLVTDIIGIYGEKLWHEGYNQALADVRKVIKEEL